MSGQTKVDPHVPKASTSLIGLSQAHKKKIYLFAKNYFLNLCVNMHLGVHGG